MRVSTTYAIAAWVAIGLSAIALVTSITPDHGLDSVTINSGDDYEVCLSTPPMLFGKIHLWYSAYSGPYHLASDAVVRVLSESQYEDYVRGSSSEDTYNMTGSQGSVRLTLERAVKYYVVTEHAPGHENEVQYVSVGHRLNGMDITQSAVGITLFAMGSALMWLGWRARGSPGLHELHPRPSDAVNRYGFKWGKWPGK